MKIPSIIWQLCFLISRDMDAGRLNRCWRTQRILYPLEVCKVSLGNNRETCVEARDQTKWFLRGHYGLGWVVSHISRREQQRTHRKLQIRPNVHVRNRLKCVNFTYKSLPNIDGLCNSLTKQVYVILNISLFHLDLYFLTPFPILRLYFPKVHFKGMYLFTHSDLS